MTEWTNIYNLPEPLARAITNDTYEHNPDPNHYAVHELINPARLTILRRRYADEVTEDVSDGLWRLMGSAVHEVINRAGTERGFQEERLRADFGDLYVTGQADLWEQIEDHAESGQARGKVTDWKITSVWSIMNTEKEEWEQQVNCYAYLYRVAGFPVTELSVHAVLRDWRPGELKQYGPSRYPVIPFAERVLPVWPQEKVHQFIKSQLKLLLSYTNTPDDKLPICSPKDRWTRDECWVIKKKGNKRAERNSKRHSEEEIKELFDTRYGQGYEIEYRPGKNVRCQDYCEVAHFCSFYQTYVKEEALG